MVHSYRVIEEVGFGWSVVDELDIRCGRGPFDSKDEAEQELAQLIAYINRHKTGSSSAPSGTPNL